MVINIKTSAPVSFTETREILEQKDEESLGYEQKVTLDYLRKIKMLDTKTVEKLKAELSKEIPVLKEHQIISIINLMPKVKEDIDTIFMKERISLTKEQTDKILQIVA